MFLQAMKKTIVFTGTIKHEGAKERTDYLCLKNGQGEDDSEGVTLLRLLLFPKGVKLNRTSAGQTDPDIRFKVFARKLTDTDSAVQICCTSQASEVDTSPKKKGNVAKSITLNIDFPTDTIVIKGCYEAISFKIEADAAGKEVQFEHVIGADTPTLTLIETAAEDVEMAEETDVKDDGEAKSESQVEVKSEGDGTGSTQASTMEEGEVKSEKEEISFTEEAMEEDKAAEEEEKNKEEIEEDAEEKEQEEEEHEDGMEEYELVLEDDHEETEEDTNKSIEEEAEPVVKMTEEEKKALEAQRAEEKRLRREREDREAGLLEEETDFTVEKFEPVKIHCRRPPWRERATPVDIKAWELFCDAVTTFESSTLDEYIDDWVVTVENLLPQLRNCFREAAMKGIPDAPEDLVENLPLLMADWARFGLCLDRADAQPSPAKFLRVGMGIVEQIAGYSFEPRYGCALLEQGIAWDLMNVITETTYSALQQDVLHVLHVLQCCRGVSLTAAAVFFRFEKANGEKNEEEKEEEEGKEKEGKEEKEEKQEEEKEKEDEMASIYDRLALLAAQMDETSCESTSLLDLTLRVLSRANLNAAAARLLAATRSVVAAAAATGGDEEARRNELSTALNSFLDRFHRNEGIVRGFGLEEDARKAYGVLAECDWTGVVSVLLSLPHDNTTERAVGFTAGILEAQECVGLFALAESSPALQRLLLKQLMMMERKETKKKDKIRRSKSVDDDSFTYDETPSLEKRKEGGRELASRIAHRLRVLHLVDELADCNKSLTFDSMDDPVRISVLHRLLRMSVTEEGEAALCSIFSQCAFSLLSSIVTAVVEDKRWEGSPKDKKRLLSSEARARPSFVYALEIMKIVSARADGAAFWTRNARHYQKMIKYQPLLPPTTSLHSWWEPFKDTVVASADLGSHTVVTAIRTRLREYATKTDDGDPPSGAVALLRVMESLLRVGRRTAAPRGAAARVETISYFLSDGIPKVIEDLLKISLEYRLSLWSLGTSIDSGTGNVLFREFVERALRILTLLYSSSLDATGSVKGLSVNAVGYAVGLWTLTTGIMKTSPSLTESGASLRREVLAFLRVMGGFEYRGEKEELEGDWEGKSALTRMLRRAMDYGKDRMQCQPAALTLLCIVQEWCEEEGGEGKWRMKFEEALKESSKAVAVLLLNYAPYSRQMAVRVFERLDRTIGGETYAALAKSIYSHFVSAFACRPKRNKHCIDKDDVSVLTAREKHLALAKIFSSMTSSRRFLVALLQTLHDDFQTSSRLGFVLSVATLSTPKWKTHIHIECQEILVDVLARLADHSFYEEDILGEMEELIEENEEEEEEEEKEEEIEEMEPSDEFLDETCLVDEEEGEKKEEGKEEEKEKKHPDLPLRICRVLVRMATAPAAAPSVAAAAIAALNKLRAHESALVKDTVLRSWVEHKWKFPLVRGLLHAATTAMKEEGRKEGVEEFLRSSLAHLLSVFGSDEEAGRLAGILDVNGTEDISLGSGGNKCILKPCVALIESLPEKEKVEWMKAVERAREMEGAATTSLAAPRSHVIYKREENDPVKREEEMAKKLSLIISVSSADYSDLELPADILKNDMDKRRKPAKNAETRLRLAERVDGLPVKRPDLSKLDRIEKAKEADKKDDSKKGSNQTMAGSAEATKAAAARLAAIKNKPAAPAAEKEKKEDNIPNRIQPAVIPSRPAKRSAPTSVPRAGIKRRR